MITDISDLSLGKYLESVDQQRPFTTRREIGAKVEINGMEYVFVSDSEQELDRMIEEKRKEIRDRRIDQIIMQELDRMIEEKRKEIRDRRIDQIIK